MLLNASFVTLPNDFIFRAPPKHDNLLSFFLLIEPVIGDYNSIINVEYNHSTLDKPTMPIY